MSKLQHPSLNTRQSIYRINPELMPRLRNSLYSAARLSTQILSIDPQLDTERWHEDYTPVTRLSKRAKAWTIDGSRSIGGSQLGSWDEDAHRLDNPVNNTVYQQYFEKAIKYPFDDSNATPEVLESGPQGVETEEPYHVMSNRQKWIVILIIGAAGFFSGLSSNIFLPSLDIIAKDLKVSLGTVSLTITSYLVVQGLSPLLWGSLSDVIGRRPIYIASFAVYIVANIGLSFSPNFAVLLIFRGLQAAGSASTISIGNGVIQDVSPPAERGAFISFYQAIRNFSIAIGPVLGGLLANSLGFRAVFVFLLILSSVVVIVIIVYLPETMRSIAGNGSLCLTGVYVPLIRRFTKRQCVLHDPEELTLRKKVTMETFIEPLKILLEKDIVLNLTFGGVVYTIWSMVTSTTTGLFKSGFGLNEQQLGLVFLPNGIGTIVGSTIIGKLLTQDYLAAEAKYMIDHAVPGSKRLPSNNLPPDFPIERARLRNLPWIAGIFTLSTAIYGFTLTFPMLLLLKGWIAVPLTLQFLIAATSNAVFALNQTLISDLFPGKGASSTAINNLVRCSFAALGVAFGENLISAFGPGAAFLGLALLTVVCVPLVVVSWYRGPGWRAHRAARMAKAEKTELN